MAAKKPPTPGASKGAQPKKPAASKKPPTPGASKRAQPKKAAPAPEEVAAAPGPDLARLMPLVGLGVAVWASLPQYSGPKLYVEASKEVADHIIPAILVLLASIVGIMAGRRPQGPGALRLIAGMAVLLAGLWMMATHIPLLLQTMRGGPDAASWAATIYHLASAMAVFGLGLLWSTVTWAEADDSNQPATQAQK